jgi:hypothetical protein
LIVLLALAVTAVAVAGPSSARADYRVVQCDYQRTSYVEAGLVAFGPYSIWPANSCGNDYGLELFTNPSTGWTANGAGVAWQFTAPSGTTFDTRVTIHYGYDSGLGGAVYSDTPGGFVGLPSCNTPSTCWAFPTALNAHYFQVRLQCFASPNCHSNWAYVYARSFEAIVHDGLAPGITAGGELFGGGVVRGIQNLNATATDAGGGARTIAVYVNGFLSRRVDFCQPDVAGSYSHLKPCPSSYTQSFAIDTQKDAGWVDGSNAVEVCSTDVGGNGSPCVQRSVFVDNSCPGSGGAVASNLDAGTDVHGKVLNRAAISSNDQPVIRGALKDGKGNPVSDATVCIYGKVDLPDASRELLSKVTTQGNGRFATVLDPGPSRDLEILYRHNDKVLLDQVRLDSRVVPTFFVPKDKRHVRNGTATRFKGALPGPNQGGRAVALQARAGKKWRTFKLLRTRADGHFHGKYRFLQTRGRQRYLFRALVKSQGGYPYEPGHSRTRKVIVSG